MPRGTGHRPCDGKMQGGVVWNLPRGTKLVGAAFMVLPVGRAQLGAQAGLLEAEVSVDLRPLGPPSTCPSLREAFPLPTGGLGSGGWPSVPLPACLANPETTAGPHGEQLGRGRCAGPGPGQTRAEVEQAGVTLN